MTTTQQPPVVPEGYELKKKKSIFARWWFWLAVIVVVAIIATTAGGGGGSSSSGSSSSSNGAAAGKVKVVYTLESDAPSVSATYATLTNGNIGQSQANSVTAPWSQELEVEDTWVKSFTLTGQMNPVLDGSAADGTTITCRITVDGEVVAEQTSTGQYAVVSCNAS
ncbi:MmpS family transport accessory protein [Geodermatophilus sp. URMC 64]